MYSALLTLRYYKNKHCGEIMILGEIMIMNIKSILLTFILTCAGIGAAKKK